MGQIVSSNFFEVLGVRPVVGRTFTPGSDETRGTDPVLVLGHGLWRRRFAADPEVVGRSLILNGRAFTIIGVAAGGFRGTQLMTPAEFWVPMTMFAELSSRGRFMDERRARMFSVMARLASGVTVEQAEAECDVLARRLAATHPDTDPVEEVALVPLTESMIPPDQRSLFRRSGELLMAAVALVLLIACANVGNLLLARATGRRQEMAVRLSTGCGRGRLIRQLLTESVILALPGGVLGLLLAPLGSKLLWSLRPPLVEATVIDFSPDARILGFTLVLSLVTAFFFGLAPALEGARTDLVEGLKSQSGLAQRGHRRFGSRELLVAAQVALTLVALIAAGLLLKSLRQAQAIDPGFRTEEVVTLGVHLKAQGYDEARGRNFYRQVLERLRSLPSVRSAAVARNPPLAPPPELRRVWVPGVTERESGELVIVDFAGEEYFETLGIPIVAGRAFRAADREDGRRVAVINQTMAERFWPGADAAGRQFRFPDDDALQLVVGVVGNGKYVTLSEPPQPYVYLPVAQHYQAIGTLYARTAGRAGALLPAIRREVQAVDETLPLLDVGTVAELVGRSLWAPRMRAALVSLFGSVALALAIGGIYAVAAYAARQRRREIALRMALGARRLDVVKLVVGKMSMAVGAGLIVGILTAMLTARFIDSLLVGVSATDPRILGGTVVLLAAVAVVASAIPALRAAGSEPATALRTD